MSYDCIVLGLGGVGSSVLFHLARRGFRVCGLEQYGPVHDQGSSHGETRVFRKAYFEHPDYVPLLHRAGDLWADLEESSGRRLYWATGVLLSGPPSGEAIPGSLASAAQHGLEIRQFSAQAARDEWPMLRFPDAHQIIFEPDAGVLAVEKCVAAHLHQADVHGAHARFNEAVCEWRVSSSQVTVTTAAGQYSAGALVLTAGAWSALQLADSLPPIQVLHKIQQWHRVENARREQVKRLPAFLFETDKGTFYGVPSLDATAIKIARHTGGTPVDDPSTVTDAAIRNEQTPCTDFARGALAGISSEPERSCGCLYTMSPDGHFIVDRHPEYERVFVTAGLSGHGFKFASVLGEVVADLVTSGETELPVAFLGLDRFQSP